VPNQNSFGHMQDWLARREFRELAECPEGFQREGFSEVREPTTLNPLDPGSLELIKDQYQDLLPNFISDLFNVGCDETWELGQGKSREACNENGTGRVYLDFLLKIYDLVQERDKKMMFWGDIIMQYPELIPELPTDIIALEWGYEADHPFARDGKRFKESGIPFYVCPGTSSWNSIAGRTENMRANLVNAAVNGQKYGAEGYLITDWGDNGHWQYLPVSYPGYAYGAALSWNVKDNQEIDLAAYLDRLVFRDNSDKMGQFVLNLGNYYQKEDKIVHNSTNIVRILYSEFDNMEPVENMSEKGLENVVEYTAELINDLDQTDMNCEDAALIEDEFRNALKMIEHGVDLGLVKLKMLREEYDLDLKKMLEIMIDDISLLIKNHQQLWLSRNRYSNLDHSLEQFYNLKEEYLDYYQKKF
ncbi:MAG: family 20 glycosylhydrolase, partial [Halanaerobiales bacterium]